MTEGLIKKAGNSSIETRQRACAWQHTHGCVQSKPGHLSTAPFTSGYTNTPCDPFPIHSHSFLLFLITFFFILAFFVSQGKNRWRDKESNGCLRVKIIIYMPLKWLTSSSIWAPLYFFSLHSGKFPTLLLSVAVPNIRSSISSHKLIYYLSNLSEVIVENLSGGERGTGSEIQGHIKPQEHVH